MRLDKLISNNTKYSRKEVNKLIKNNCISVNDKIINSSSFNVNEYNDVIKINNVLINTISKIYILLNKPKGYICSNSDKDGPIVFDLIKENYIKDLHCVGRLDKNTTGLILITNDGQFTHKIQGNSIEKEYEVTLEHDFTLEMDNELKKDIYMDGKKLKPFTIFNINKNKLNITLIEGKNHEIKRLFAIVKNPVFDLKRVRIDKLKLDQLKISEGNYIIFDKAPI